MDINELIGEIENLSIVYCVEYLLLPEFDEYRIKICIRDIGINHYEDIVAFRVSREVVMFDTLKVYTQIVNRLLTYYNIKYKYNEG